jgi:hydrophobe/amphiphile efflux-1 (HAE1) family protein
VENTVMLGGFDIFTGGSNSTNAAVLFLPLKPFDERPTPELSAQRLVLDAFAEFSALGEGVVVPFNPPAIQGLGQRAGFQLELQSRSGGSVTDLARVSDEFIAAAAEDPALTGLQGTLRVTLPQLFVELDRDKTKMMGVSVSGVFETLQAYLGSLYVNDFNRFGRIWRVQIQAEPEFRDSPADLRRIHVRNERGEMVPLSGVVESSLRAGPNVVSRFNGFPSVQITGAPAVGVSSGEAMGAVRRAAAEHLPAGYGFEWSGASYQEIQAGNQTPIVLGFGLVAVFLVLASQYEKWTMPFAVLLGLPIAVLGALLAIWGRGLSQDIYFQVGLLTLVGLASKNAILIVEFCLAAHRQGVPVRQAAVRAAGLRFRPIVMTSLAFILGVVPLAVSTGAGSAARHSIGTGVIGGMLASTFIAVFFIPVFFVVIQGVSERVVARLRSAPRDGEAGAGAG